MRILVNKSCPIMSGYCRGLPSQDWSRKMRKACGKPMPIIIILLLLLLLLLVAAFVVSSSIIIISSSSGIIIIITRGGGLKAKVETCWKHQLPRVLYPRWCDSFQGNVIVIACGLTVGCSNSSRVVPFPVISWFRIPINYRYNPHDL